MPYDRALLERSRRILSTLTALPAAASSVEGTPDLEEKKMFGGVAFMLRGNMACGLMSDGGFMVRVHPDRAEEVLEHPHARLMEHGGRQMRGFVLVAPEGVADDEALARWIGRALEHAATLPTKEAKPGGARRGRRGA